VKKGWRVYVKSLWTWVFILEKLEKMESDTITYRFTIPSREHERFIDEIGSFKPEHIRVFEEYRRLKGEKG